MAARAIASGTISFGLVSIPVKLYVAASPQSVRFNQLHAACGSRIRMQNYCPVCEVVLDRSDIVKGYEYAKGQYVRFEDEELKALEAERTHSLDINEFVPLDQVDLVQVDKSYYLGPDKGGDRAYRMLSEAMERSGKVAVGRWMMRGKEQLVVLRPYRDGLLLHYIFHADEVRAFDDVPKGGEVKYRKGELEMAEQLIGQLSTDALDLSQYEDTYRERVAQAVEQKVAGKEITVAPEQPQAQVIDLFEALKASLDQQKPAAQGEGKGAKAAQSRPKGKPAAARPRQAAKAKRKKRSAG
jgi:DNA end-binding protein Ku